MKRKHAERARRAVIRECIEEAHGDMAAALEAADILLSMSDEKQLSRIARNEWQREKRIRIMEEMLLQIDGRLAEMRREQEEANLRWQMASAAAAAFSVSPERHSETAAENAVAAKTPSAKEDPQAFSYWLEDAMRYGGLG